MAEAKQSDYSADDFVVYPTHGVGKVLGVEIQEISGISLELIIIKFHEDHRSSTCRSGA